MARRLYLLLLTILLAVIVHAKGETVFSNLSQVTDDAGIPNLLGRIATDFQTSEFSARLEGITLKLRNSDSITHTFTAHLFTDLNGVPGSLISSFQKLTLPPGQVSFSEYDAAVSPVSISANTQYWIVLQTYESNVDTGVGWAETTSDAADAGSFFSTIPSTPNMANNGGNWVPQSPGNFQFSLSAPVPEPHCIHLVLTSVGLLGLQRRRRHWRARMA